MWEMPINKGCMQEWLLGVLEAVVQQHEVDHLQRCVFTFFSSCVMLRLVVSSCQSLARS